MRNFTKVVGTGILLLSFMYCIGFAYELGLYSAKTQVEIYTTSNIYYINGLKVTNEVNDSEIIFSNVQSLNEYIHEKLTLER